MEQDAAVATDLEAFVEAFDDFVRAAKRARARVALEDELSPAQFGLLYPLLGADRSPGVRELAVAAGVAAPTATRMLDGLEARGLVTRERRTDDRRGVRLTLTQEGERLVRERHGSLMETRRAIYASLDDDERAAAAAVLRRLAVALSEVGV
jgi:DNA-binding MarR family transcriptional regulator